MLHSILYDKVHVLSVQRSGPEVQRCIRYIKISGPLDCMTTQHRIDFIQLLLGEFDIARLEIFQGARGSTAKWDENKQIGFMLVNRMDAYDDPGKGMTCSPSWATQASDSCAGVIPFLEAMAKRSSAMERLCCRLSPWNREKRLRTSPSVYY